MLRSRQMQLQLCCQELVDFARIANPVRNLMSINQTDTIPLMYIIRFNIYFVGCKSVSISRKYGAQQLPRFQRQLIILCAQPLTTF